MVCWKINGLYKADANEVYDELQTLGDKFTPADVVDLARNESSALHSCFEWDDTVAAENYRRSQAQTLIRMIVFVDEKKNASSNIRVLVSTGERSGAYSPTRIIVQNADEYKALLERAMAELRAFKEKYKMLKELDYILELIH